VSPLNKSLLTIFVIMLLALAAWGIQTAQDSQASRFVRGCLWTIALGIIVILVALTTHFAHARDDGQWEKSDPAIREWYQGLMMPDIPKASCCAEADAYWCDRVNVRKGATYCTITDDRPDAPLGRPHIENGTEVAGLHHCAVRQRVAKFIAIRAYHFPVG
jgi:hypothetical protein